MNINQIKDFTRPNGRPGEFRSKYVMHRIKSALLLGGGEEDVKRTGHRVESPKLVIGKKKYEYDPEKDELLKKLLRSKQANAKGYNQSCINFHSHSERNRDDKPRGKRQVNQSQLYPPLMYKKLNPSESFNKTQQFLSRESPRPMTNDAYKPKDFDIVHVNPIPIKSQRFHINIPKQLKERMINSDIFFRKRHNEDHQGNSSRRDDRNKSDILCRNNSDFFIKKSAEAYLFRKPLVNKYTSSNESHSNWYHNISKPSMMNFSDTTHNPINPKAKNNSMSKRDILAHFNNNLYAIAKKQKSLCEFLDITHLGAPNPNKDYLNNYAASNQCFHKTKDLCGSYMDLKRNLKE